MEIRKGFADVVPLVVETLTRPPSQVYITLKHVAICWLPRTKESLPSLFTIHRNFAFSRTRPIRRPHFRLSWIIYTPSIYTYIQWNTTATGSSNLQIGGNGLKYGLRERN